MSNDKSAASHNVSGDDMYFVVQTPDERDGSQDETNWYYTFDDFYMPDKTTTTARSPDEHSTEGAAPAEPAPHAGHPTERDTRAAGASGDGDEQCTLSRAGKRVSELGYALYDHGEDTKTCGATIDDDMQDLTPTVTTSSSGKMMTHVLVRFGTLYGVYFVPAELRDGIGLGDLVVCESWSGECTGVVLADVSPYLTLLREERREVMASYAYDPLFPCEVDCKGTSDTPADACAGPVVPLYDQPPRSGLPCDGALRRLPRVLRRGINKDRKKVYFSHRRDVEGLPAVRRLLRERNIHYFEVHDTEYQADLRCVTLHLRGRRAACPWSEAEFSAFGSFLSDPLRTSLVVFRYSQEDPTLLHLTHALLGDSVVHWMTRIISATLAVAPKVPSYSGTDNSTCGTSSHAASPCTSCADTHPRTSTPVDEPPRQSTLARPLQAPVLFSAGVDAPYLVDVALGAGFAPSPTNRAPAAGGGVSTPWYTPLTHPGVLPAHLFACATPVSRGSGKHGGGEAGVGRDGVPHVIPPQPMPPQMREPSMAYVTGPAPSMMPLCPVANAPGPCVMLPQQMYNVTLPKMVHGPLVLPCPPQHGGGPGVMQTSTMATPNAQPGVTYWAMYNPS